MKNEAFIVIAVAILDRRTLSMSGFERETQGLHIREHGYRGNECHSCLGVTLGDLEVGGKKTHLSSIRSAAVNGGYLCCF